MIIGAVVVIAIVAFAAFTLADKPGGSSTSAHAKAPAAGAVLKPTISSFDPSGGSGFRHQGTSWRTQTYRSSKFGNLKPGVGLQLDLGTASSVSTVGFDAGSGPITVQLRSADQQSGLSGYTPVGSAESASGQTTLTGSSGGKHRYWMLWVTELGPQSGGFDAVITDLTVRG